MSEIMNQLIEDSKIESLALMLQDGISEEKACRYLQIPLERREDMLRNSKKSCLLGTVMPDPHKHRERWDVIWRHVNKE